MREVYWVSSDYLDVYYLEAKKQFCRWFYRSHWGFAKYLVVFIFSTFYRPILSNVLISIVFIYLSTCKIVLSSQESLKQYFFNKILTQVEIICLFW